MLYDKFLNLFFYFFLQSYAYTPHNRKKFLICILNWIDHLFYLHSTPFWLFLRLYEIIARELFLKLRKFSSFLRAMKKCYFSLPYSCKSLKLLRVLCAISWLIFVFLLFSSFFYKFYCMHLPQKQSATSTTDFCILIFLSLSHACLDITIELHNSLPVSVALVIFLFIRLLLENFSIINFQREVAMEKKVVQGFFGLYWEPKSNL